MSYALQQKQTPTSETTPESGATTQTPRQPEDLVPEENKAAQQGGGDPDKAAADKAAEERKAKVTAKWESMLGKWLGGKLAPLVIEHVSLDALNGYVQEGLNAAGPALGKALKEETKPDKAQEKALKEFSDALAGVMTGQVEKWIQSEGGQKVLKAIGGWVEDNPGWVMTIIGSAVIGGALAVWFTNQDLPNIEIPLKLGGTTLKAGLDLGTIQQLGFQGASLVVANKNAKINAKAEVKKKEDKDDDGNVTNTTHTGSVAVSQGDKGKETLTFVMNGSVSESADGLVAHTAGGSLKLVDPDNGVTLTVGADGKWDSTGAKQDSFNYALQTAANAPVSGKLSFGTKNVTIVDKDGNIVTSSSHEIAVAVGDKANKFEANLKSENKDGAESTSIGVKGQAQLGASLFKGDANVEVGEGETRVKLNGQLKTTIGGKEVTFDGAFETDGPITGKIRVGSGDAYREISGTKSGDVVTFKTKDVFAGGSLERETTSNADGTVANQLTATTQIGKNATLTASGGDKGTNVGIDAKNIGGSGLSANAHAGDDGYGAGLKYDEGWLKAHLDYTMKQGTGALNMGASVNSPGGFQFDSNLKLEDDRIKELGVRLGYKDPEEFRTFLVGYKQKWMGENKEQAHSFDALLEYSWGNWSARLNGNVDLMGNQVQKTKIDLMGGYKLNKDWAVIGGMQVEGAMGNDGGMKQNYKPYVGMQYGNIGVAGYFDSQNKGGGIMLTMPLSFGKRR